MSLNLAHRWRAETGRHKPRSGWEAVLAMMAERGAVVNRERAEAAERLAQELRQANKIAVGMK